MWRCGGEESGSVVEWVSEVVELGVLGYGSEDGAYFWTEELCG